MTSYSDEQLQQLAEVNLKRCLSLAEVHFQRSFPEPSINFKQRGRAAGVAYLQRNEIRLNMALCRHNIRAFLGEVIPHEAAHLIAYQLHGAKIRPHGREWQYIMSKVFGLAPRRTHDFDIGVAVKQYAYQCGCRVHQLSTRRHNNVQLRRQNYLCNQCKQPLTFLS